MSPAMYLTTFVLMVVCAALLFRSMQAPAVELSQRDIYAQPPVWGFYAKSAAFVVASLAGLGSFVKYVIESGALS